ncbi:MAG: peptidoglycan -binding protein [Rhodospirillales bacterium]|nr:peptidoglycan -binding protein [Rhodospirillales bacterium]
MAALSRRNQHRTDIWPGFVDALASLLMVIIFLLMIFVIAQFFLGEALTGRDQALDRLHGQVSELADLLNLERKANETLRINIAQLSDELSASVTLRDDQKQQIQALSLLAETAENQAKKLKSDLASAMKSVATDQAKIKQQLSEIATLSDDIEKLKALREELETTVKAQLTSLASKDEAIITEKKLSKTARAEVALLNKQLRAIRQQIAQIAATLDASEALAKKQRARIANLGKRLNAALASKVQELSRYRSEFFGKLRDVLGNQKGIRIVGDRFVFQSEVLFTTGSADLGSEGKTQIIQLAGTLKEIIKKIPPKIEWILRVDGHTDRVPIQTSRFPTNWELSTARAISVVKFLVGQGISPTNLAATGFGEFQPIDPRDDEIANLRNRRIELKLTQR